MHLFIFYLFIYIHIRRNLLYYSFKLNYVWLIGVIILFLSIATAFLGYVLPRGQISFWAIVIANLSSALPYTGQIIVERVWGGFSINNSTLNRFCSFHFILIIVFLHLITLHISGSTNYIYIYIFAHLLSTANKVNCLRVSKGGVPPRQFDELILSKNSSAYALSFT